MDKQNQGQRKKEQTASSHLCVFVSSRLWKGYLEGKGMQQTSSFGTNTSFRCVDSMGYADIANILDINYVWVRHATATAGLGQRSCNLPYLSLARLFTAQRSVRASRVGRHTR